MKKMNEMSEKAKQLRREYNRKYRELNKDIINKRHNQWRHANKDKIKEYSKNYWEKKTKGLNTLNNNSNEKDQEVIRIDEISEEYIERAIKLLKKDSTDYYYRSIDVRNSVKVALNYIDKLQKELEEKTTILMAGADKVKQLEKENTELKKDISNMYNKEVVISIICDNFDMTRLEVLEMLGED